jgi:hypothetical protein
MELLNSIDLGEVSGWSHWIKRVVAHPASQKVNFHFHEVEERLEVIEGNITFFSAGGHELEVDQGQMLRIPQGEVHRVEIGPQGVLYNMWLPADVSPAAFSHFLSCEDMALIRENLKLPERENERDSGRRTPPRAAIPEALLAAFLSAKLSFRTAGGSTLSKHSYLERQPSQGTRKSEETESVCVLHQCPSCMFLSTIVEVDGSPSPKSYMNLRLFAREEDVWRCVSWMNFEG